MKSLEIEKVRRWIFNHQSLTGWLIGMIIGIAIGVIFLLLMNEVADKAYAYTHPNRISETSVQTASYQDPYSSYLGSPTVPSECIIALQKADDGYSTAYFAALNRKHLSHRARLALETKMEQQAFAYKQYREICFRLASDY